jgi:uncharacterized SAM-dependent methyltransferase
VAAKAAAKVKQMDTTRTRAFFERMVFRRIGCGEDSAIPEIECQIFSAILWCNLATFPDFGDSFGMPTANVLIDSSQFPESVRRSLLESLRTRKINHKFHYDSYKQAQKWLALHDAYSPARNDANCEGIYDRAFLKAAQSGSDNIHLIGLGCGGGQKEMRLLKLLKEQGTSAAYSPCDVSLALVLTARNVVSDLVPDDKCRPVVCDLAEAQDVAGMFSNARGKRIVTFFGMIPNFEPDLILPRLRSVLNGDDLLLFSANLSPGENYTEGVRKILPQYDNELTKEWLITFLLDLGVERGDGEVVFEIEEIDRYQRVVANFQFRNSREIRLGDERIRFGAGEQIRLFFSYRYQPSQIVAMLKEHRIGVLESWVTESGEEGVFLCQAQS